MLGFIAPGLSKFFVTWCVLLDNFLCGLMVQLKKFNLNEIEYRWQCRYVQNIFSPPCAGCATVKKLRLSERASYWGDNANWTCSYIRCIDTVSFFIFLKLGICSKQPVLTSITCNIHKVLLFCLAIAI